MEGAFQCPLLTLFNDPHLTWSRKRGFHEVWGGGGERDDEKKGVKYFPSHANSPSEEKPKKHNLASLGWEKRNLRRGKEPRQWDE